MAIDEELIAKTISQLGERITKLRDEEREIQTLINKLHNIQKTGGNIPKNPLTDEPLTDKEIKDVFNSVAKKATKYMGGK